MPTRWKDELHERATAALVRSAKELRMILEATPAPVMIARQADGEIVYANVMLGTLFQPLAHELVGRKTIDLSTRPRSAAGDRALEAERAVRSPRSPVPAAGWLVGLGRHLLAPARFQRRAGHPVGDARHHRAQGAEERLHQQVEALRLELEETSKDTALARGTARRDSRIWMPR